MTLWTSKKDNAIEEVTKNLQNLLISAEKHRIDLITSGGVEHKLDANFSFKRAFFESSILKLI